MKGRLTARNARKVFDAILALDEETQTIVLDSFNSTLDELRDGDTFGTEGQTDPRGDKRR